MYNSVIHPYIAVCSLPKVKSPSIIIYSLFTFFYLPPPPFPLVITILLPVSMSCFFYLIPLPCSPSLPTSLQSDSCQSVFFIYESVSILLVFILFIIFHTQVKSYNISLSQTGLFHLA